MIYYQTILVVVLLLSCICIIFLITTCTTRRFFKRLLYLQEMTERVIAGEDVHIENFERDKISQLSQAILTLVTEYKRVRETLQIFKNTTEANSLSKARFLAIASHDLRQPLQALELFVTALLGMHLPEESHIIAEKINFTVSDLRTLLEALFDISKLDAGAIIPERIAFSVTTLIKRLASEFEPFAVAKGLRFHIGPCKGVIVSDPVLLNRIMRNLLSNAIHYTTFGGILIGCRNRGKSIKIEVWDTGCGIPMDQQEKIFHEFHQISPSNQNSGVGLGLAIVNRLACLLKHEIIVRSRLGRGSVFTVTVGTVPGMYKSRNSKFIYSLRTKTIAVIDSDTKALKTFSDLLTGLGYTTILAHSSDEVILELSRFEVIPEVIIANYQLVGETGNQAITYLREIIGRSLPAFLMVEQASSKNLEQVQVCEFPILNKPVTSKQLLDLFSKHKIEEKF